MWRVMMTFLIPLPLVLLIGAAFIYIEHEKHRVAQKAFGEDELTITEFAKVRLTSILQTRVRKEEISKIDVAIAMPQAPEGWMRTRYVADHGTAITGSPYEKSLVVKDTEKSLQDDFLKVRKYQKDKMAYTYSRGDQHLAVRIKIVAVTDSTTLEGKLTQSITNVAPSLAAVKEKPENPIVLILGDTPVRLLPQISQDYLSGEERRVRYQRYRGRIGGRLEILAFGNVTPVDARAILGGIDHTMLAGYVDRIEQAVVVADATQTGQSEPDQDTPSADAAEAKAPVSKAEETSWLASLSGLARGSDKPAEVVRLKCSRTSAGFKRCAQE